MNLQTNFASQSRYLGSVFAVFFIIFSSYGLFDQGLNFGIDFSGGYVTEFTSSKALTPNEMQSLIAPHIQSEFSLSSNSDYQYWTLRQPPLITELESSVWFEKLNHKLASDKDGLSLSLMDADFIDSQIGKELLEQGGLALLSALIAILLYLSSRFEWRFALGSIIALTHDVIVVLGVFAWTQIEVDLTVLASLLAILGYSLNDSIIVCDRVRELMKTNSQHSLDRIINLAIKSTLARTLITSGTTLFTITSIWILAGQSLQGFALALFCGILIGTYSSICVTAIIPEITRLKPDYFIKKEQFEEEYI